MFLFGYDCRISYSFLVQNKSAQITNAILSCNRFAMKIICSSFLYWLKNRIETKLRHKTVPALVPAFGEHLTYSFFSALRLFLISNQSLSTPFPYKDPYSLSQQIDFLCFLWFGLFFVVVLLVFVSKDASFLRDLDSSYTVSCVCTRLQVVVPWSFLNYLLYFRKLQLYLYVAVSPLEFHQYNSSPRSGP